MAQQILASPGSTPYDWRFSLLGVPVRTHPLFWLVGALIAYGSAGDDLVRIIIGVACVFLSILIHEFGHALSGRYYGDTDNSVVLYMMGGLCIPGWQGVPPRWPRIIMIFWGPLAGFLLAGIAYGVYFAVAQTWIPVPPKDVLFAIVFLISINILWSIMNLLPVYPLDGGQIVREWLMWKRPERGEFLAFTISMVAGFLTAAGLTAYGIVTKSIPVFGIIFFIYLGFQSWQLRQAVLLYGSLGGEPEEPRAAWEQDPDWWKKG